MDNDIERQLKAALDAGKINGAVFCSTDAKGGFIYNKALGQRTLLSGETKPLQLDDILCISSATKLITTVAALQSVDDGLLTLTGDLSSVAPELASLQVITGFTGETPLLEPPARPITLQMLLTHSAGCSYYFLDQNVARWHNRFAPRPQDGKSGGEGEHQRQPVEGDIHRHPLSFHPDAGWMYGVGVDWAGRIVERVTGRTLGTYMHERIFGPLGVAGAQHFFPVTREDLRSRMVDLNPTDPEGLGIAVLGGGGEMNKHTEGDFGGHGLFMTGADFVLVLRSLLANDGKLLQPTTVDSMFAPDLLSPKAAASLDAVMAGDLGMFFHPDPEASPKTSQGLGGLLLLEASGDDGWYGARTLAWGGGLTLMWFIDRERDLCGICAIQPSLPIQGSDRILALKHMFFRDIYRKQEAWNK